MPIYLEGNDFYGKPYYEHFTLTLENDGQGHASHLSPNSSRWFNVGRLTAQLVRLDHIIGWNKYITHNRKPKRTTTLLSTGTYIFRETRSKKTKNRERAFLKITIE